jgi:hypothetical protein
MFESLRSLPIPPMPAKSRDTLYTAGGLLALLCGRKVSALALFGKGLLGLEKAWRDAHPEFTGGLDERWRLALDFYEATHKDGMNRKLHVIGIPFIVAGTAGLLIFPAYRPLWGLSAAAFVGGWALNFVGHGFFEKNAPAFADDPLSFIAGPVWDFQQLFGRGDAAHADEPDSARGNGAHTHASA